MNPTPIYVVNVHRNSPWYRLISTSGILGTGWATWIVNHHGSQVCLIARHDVPGSQGPMRGAVERRAWGNRSMFPRSLRRSIEKNQKMETTSNAQQTCVTWYEVSSPCCRFWSWPLSRPSWKITSNPSVFKDFAFFFTTKCWGLLAQFLAKFQD